MGATEEDVQVAVAKYKAHFPEWRLDSFPGFLGNVTAGRCSNVFNLDGMNAVVDAACASSLVSVKVAIDELLYGHCRAEQCTQLKRLLSLSRLPYDAKSADHTQLLQRYWGMPLGGTPTPD